MIAVNFDTLMTLFLLKAGIVPMFCIFLINRWEEWSAKMMPKDPARIHKVNFRDTEDLWLTDIVAFSVDEGYTWFELEDGTRIRAVEIDDRLKNFEILDEGIARRLSRYGRMIRRIDYDFLDWCNGGTRVMFEVGNHRRTAFEFSSYLNADCIQLGGRATVQ